MTISELIDDSLLLLGVGAPGDSIDPFISNVSLRQLQRMLSSWAVEGYPVPSKALDEIVWDGGSSMRTIGPTGDLVTEKPVDILDIHTRIGTIDYPTQKISYEEYLNIPSKSTGATYPQVFAYNNTSPDGQIYFYPVPLGNITVRIASYKDFSTLKLSDTLEFPTGYEEAIQFNLAVRVAPLLGAEASGYITNKAFVLKHNLEIANSDDSEMYPDPMVPLGKAQRGCNINRFTMGA